MYIFGGETLDTSEIKNDLWSFNFTTNQWRMVTANSQGDLPLGVKHHTAHVIGDKMLVIWGSPQHGQLLSTRLVQLFDFGESCPLTLGPAYQSN